MNRFKHFLVVPAFKWLAEVVAHANIKVCGVVEVTLAHRCAAALEAQMKFNHARL